MACIKYITLCLKHTTFKLLVNYIKLKNIVSSFP
jgi:hypothetical protein